MRRIAEALAETRARIAARRFRMWLTEERAARPFAEIWQVALRARRERVWL